jgi:hypothetical protein
MSPYFPRDPEDGKSRDPRTLHRYLYASGDPVNRVDPFGRADLIQTVEIYYYKVVDITEEHLFEVAVCFAWDKLVDALIDAVSDELLGRKGRSPFPWWFCELPSAGAL